MNNGSRRCFCSRSSLAMSVLLPVPASEKKRALCSLLMFRFSDIKPASTENQEVPITGARSSIAMLLSFFCLQSRLKILIPSVLLMGQLMALGSKHNSTASDPSARPALSAEMLRLPMQFEPNAGQTDSQVQFLSRGPGYTLFL